MLPSRKVLFLSYSALLVAHALEEGLAGDYDEVVVQISEEAFLRASAELFDLIILDLMLLGQDGIEVLTTLRKRALQTPVLILTAKDASEDRVLGLASGAGSYDFSHGEHTEA